MRYVRCGEFSAIGQVFDLLAVTYLCLQKISILSSLKASNAHIPFIFIGK